FSICKSMWLELPATGDGGNLSPTEINGSCEVASEFSRARTSPLESFFQVCHTFKGESHALVSDCWYELSLDELGGILRSFLLMAVAEHLKVCIAL
uniref:Uncharacterized protein n=1 Tax=Strigops habroptila TaxID=2489341 RepID=A0A672VD98_STRHB